jgi:transcriptional regulator GlxA family with amidase domain
MKTRRIGVLALPGVQLLDVAGPIDVFAEANAQAGTRAYIPFVIGLNTRPVRSSSGVAILPEATCNTSEGRLDTILVAGTPRAGRETADPVAVEWLRRVAPTTRRYGSVCSGAFLLGASGLLDGRRVTTHWAVAEQLAASFPETIVEPDALFLRDGPVRTAAGVTAGLDLALALVEEDLGQEIARRVAAQLVMYFRRPGGQMQFSRRGEAALAGRAALQELQRYVTTHPNKDHRVPRLAKRVGLSPRHFARLFRAEIGISPAVWVETARVEAARMRLEDGRATPKQVAAACGFANTDVFRNAFRRRLGVTPAHYRKGHAVVEE